MIPETKMKTSIKALSPGFEMITAKDGTAAFYLDVKDNIRCL